MDRDADVAKRDAELEDAARQVRLTAWKGAGRVATGLIIVAIGMAYDLLDRPPGLATIFGLLMIGGADTLTHIIALRRELRRDEGGS